MEFTPEEKLKVEIPLKACLKSLLDVLEAAGQVGVAKSANKIDDLVMPVIEPLVKDQLNKIIDGMKL